MQSILSPVKDLVGVAGFELATPCTPCKCATRLRYTPKNLKKMARLAGIEPTTPWFVAKYSIQLSYSRARPKL
jgi:hypothetical protein